MTLDRLVFVCLVTAMPSLVAAQSSDLTDLRKEIETLRATQLAMQTDLQEIKAILQRPTQAAHPSGPVANAIVSLRDVMIKGNVTARVALVEFSDYECPFCGRYATQSFPEVEREYIDTGKIQYAFIDFPLESIHPQAVKAAEAALCAGDQGIYWDMHDRLMRNQNARSPSALPTQAAAMPSIASWHRSPAALSSNPAKSASSRVQGLSMPCMSSRPCYVIPTCRAVSQTRPQRSPTHDEFSAGKRAVPPSTMASGNPLPAASAMFNAVPRSTSESFNPSAFRRCAAPTVVPSVTSLSTENIGTSTSLSSCACRHSSTFVELYPRHTSGLTS
ncbi:MAG: hypothetical protein DMF95_12325 [Acidobacteria bacterium]|nr:MAG: hypothetical protein DMF95_12325 [Acidobacteriota bacterium]